MLHSCDEFLVGADGRSLGADALVVIPHYLSLIGAKDDLHLALLYASTSIPQQLAYPLCHLITSQPPIFVHLHQTINATVVRILPNLAGYLPDNKFYRLPKRNSLVKSILQVSMKSGDNFIRHCWLPATLSTLFAWRSNPSTHLYQLVFWTHYSIILCKPTIFAPNYFVCKFDYHINYLLAY